MQLLFVARFNEFKRKNKALHTRDVITIVLCVRVFRPKKMKKKTNKIQKSTQNLIHNGSSVGFFDSSQVAENYDSFGQFFLCIAIQNQVLG